jgi:hypothetical protein
MTKNVIRLTIACGSNGCHCEFQIEVSLRDEVIERMLASGLDAFRFDFAIACPECGQWLDCRYDFQRDALLKYLAPEISDEDVSRFMEELERSDRIGFG